MMQERRMYQGNYLSGNKREIFEARHPAFWLEAGNYFLFSVTSHTYNFN
jgi:hypothetical protein